MQNYQIVEKSIEESIISTQLAEAITTEHRAHFEEKTIVWINYPFSQTHQIGLGYGGQANFYSIFALASDVKLWAIKQGYLINIINVSNYKYDDPFSYDDWSIRHAYKFTVRKLGEPLIFYTSEVITEGYSDCELEVFTTFQAGDFLVKLIKTKKESFN